MKKSSIPVQLALVWLAFSILWMLGLALGQQLFPVEIPPTGETPGTQLLLFLLACLLNSIVLLPVIRRWRKEKGSLALTLFVLIFGIPFFLAQMEGFVFISALKMPVQIIYSSLFAGVVLGTGIAWLGARLHPGVETAATLPFRLTAGRLLMLSMLVYPMLYLLFGYFIAWQHEALRIFYTGSGRLASFAEQMADFFSSGLYALQVGRGVLWVLIGLAALRGFSGARLEAALMLGSLFAVLMNAQLLLPNPYMPGEVAFPHLLETASSNFLWGWIIAWVLSASKKNNPTT